MKISICNDEFRIKDCKGLSSVRGLMFDSLSKWDGAFIYANSIWMPFIKKELQLIFLDDDYRVTSIKNAVPMTLNPRTWKIYTDARASYCLEVARKTKASSGMKLKIL